MPGLLQLLQSFRTSPSQQDALRWTTQTLSWVGGPQTPAGGSLLSALLTPLYSFRPGSVSWLFVSVTLGETLDVLGILPHAT